MKSFSITGKSHLGEPVYQLNKLQLIKNLCYIAVTVVWFFLPVASILLLLLMVNQSFFRQSIYPLLLISISFGLIGSTGRSNGQEATDIMRYYDFQYIYSQAKDFHDFLLVAILQGDVNFIFQAIDYGLALLFPYNVQVLPFFWVTITYFFTFLTCREIETYWNKANGIYLYPFLVACCILGVVSFYDSTELIKQCSSVAIMGYAFTLKMNKRKSYLLFGIISLFVHFSSFFIIPIFLFSSKKYSPLTYLIVLIICTGLASFNIFAVGLEFSKFIPLPGNLKEKLLFYEYLNAWEVNSKTYYIIALYFIVLIYCFLDLFLSKYPAKQKIWGCNFLFFGFCFLLINYTNIHNIIRYTKTYFPFFLFQLFCIGTTTLNKLIKYVFLFALVLFNFYGSVSMLYFRTQAGGPYSNSYLDNSIWNILSYNVADYLKFDVHYL